MRQKSMDLSSRHFSPGLVARRRRRRPDKAPRPRLARSYSCSPSSGPTERNAVRADGYVAAAESWLELRAGFMYRQCLALAVVLCLFSGPVSAAGADDSCTLEVIVKDTTGAVVPGARVMLEPGRLETFTDLYGTGNFAELTAGNYSLKVSAQGFKEENLPDVEVLQGVVNSLEVVLTLAGFKDMVTVTATRTNKKLEEVPIRTEIVSRDMIKLTASRTLADAVEFMTGLRVESNCQNCNFSQIRLLGLKGGYSQILYDGQATMSSVAMVYGIEQIPASMIEQVEVVKGGGSALYGPGSVGGVINIIPARPSHTSAFFEGRYEPMRGLPNYSLNAGGSFVSKYQSTAFTLYGQADRIKPLDLDGDGFTEVAKRDFKALGFRLDQQMLGSSARLTFDFNRTEDARRGGDRLDLPEHEANIAESIQSRRSAAGFSWYHSVSSALDYRFTLSYAYLHRNSYYGAGMDPNAYGATDSPLWVLDSQINHYLSKHVLSWGGQLTREQLQDVQPAYNREVDDTYTNTGFYLQDDWFFAKGWEIVYGLRIDKHSEISRPVVSPRAALMWNPLPDLKFRGSVATGFRPPQVFDEDLHITQVGGEGHVIRNRPDLKQEDSATLTLGTEWTPRMGDGNGLVEFNLFWTGIDDLHTVVEDDDPSTPEVEFSRINFGSAKVYGMELNLGYGIAGKYQVEFGYVEQRSRFGQPEPDFGSKDFFKSPNRYGVASFTWKNPRCVDVFLGAKFTGSMVVPHYAGWIPEDRLETTSPYFTLDASVSKRFLLGWSDSNVVISVGGKNLNDAIQNDLDQGPDRDSGYVWGPRFPRSIYTSVRFHF